MTVGARANHKPWSPLAGRTLTAAVVAAPLFLLLAPAIHYALDTPIGLFERSPWLSYRFNSLGDFGRALHGEMAGEEHRFRPFFSFWNGLQWKLFGEVAWLHHLVRWLMQFGAVSFFMAAFGRVANAGTAPAGAGRMAQVLPMAMLAYVWLLFPTTYVIVRLECVELYTMFFLGVCNFAAALMLTAPRDERRWDAAGRHALLVFGFVGLLGSKEVNVAPALWLLLCYLAFVVVRGASRQRLLVGLALACTLAFVVHRVSETLAFGQRRGAYWATTQPFLERFADHSVANLQGLFLWQTSPLLSAVLALPLVGVLAAVGWRVIRRRRLDAELAFIVLLVGEGVGMALVLAAQYGTSLRYWSILVPCLATLLAFAAKFAFAAAGRRRALAGGVAVLCVGFLALFVSANYYNFLYQAAIQHSERNLDDRLLAEVAELINAGEHLQARPDDLRFEQVGLRIDTHWNQQAYWPDSPVGGSLRRAPPEDPREPYYLLDFGGYPGWISLRPHRVLVARGDYDVLRWAHRVATWVQGGSPHRDGDRGLGFLALGNYRWAIHAVPYNLGQYLQDLVAAAGERIGDGFFRVHSDGAKLTYVRRQCEDEDTKDKFFLHFHPMDESDLPPGGTHPYQKEDFYFSDWGVRDGALCVMVRTVPQYPIKRILTGQYVPSTGIHTWQTAYPQAVPSP